MVGLGFLHGSVAGDNGRTLPTASISFRRSQFTVYTDGRTDGHRYAATDLPLNSVSSLMVAHPRINLDRCSLASVKEPMNWPRSSSTCTSKYLTFRPRCIVMKRYVNILIDACTRL